MVRKRSRKEEKLVLKFKRQDCRMKESWCSTQALTGHLDLYEMFAQFIFEVCRASMQEFIVSICLLFQLCYNAKGGPRLKDLGPG